jgi:hypothetical protein
VSNNLKGPDLGSLDQLVLQVPLNQYDPRIWIVLAWTLASHGAALFRQH